MQSLSTPKFFVVFELHREKLGFRGQKVRLRDERLGLLLAIDEESEAIKAVELLDEGAEDLDINWVT